jgi:hypothetical protein
MACNCNAAQKKDLNYIRIMAGHFSKIVEKNVQIYHYTLRGIGKVYDFEEEQEGRPQIVEIIKFRANKSKNVLRNTRVGESGATSKEVVKTEPVVKKKRRRKSTE